MLQAYFHGKYSDKLHPLSTISSGLYNQDPPCYVHRFESNSLPIYSFGKKDVPPRKFLPKNYYIVEQTQVCMSPPEHYRLNLFKFKVI